MYWRRTMGRCEWVEFEINMLAMKQSEVDATGGRIGECGTGSSADYRHIYSGLRNLPVIAFVPFGLSIKLGNLAQKPRTRLPLESHFSLDRRPVRILPTMTSLANRKAGDLRPEDLSRLVSDA